MSLYFLSSFKMCKHISFLPRILFIEQLIYKLYNFLMGQLADCLPSTPILIGNSLHFFFPQVSPFCCNISVWSIHCSEIWMQWAVSFFIFYLNYSLENASFLVKMKFKITCTPYIILNPLAERKGRSHSESDAFQNKSVYE